MKKVKEARCLQGGSWEEVQEPSYLYLTFKVLTVPGILYLFFSAESSLLLYSAPALRYSCTTYAPPSIFSQTTRPLLHAIQRESLLIPDKHLWVLRWGGVLDKIYIVLRIRWDKFHNFIPV